MASLSPIGLWLRILPWNSKVIIDGYIFLDKITTSVDSYKFMFLSLIAALAVSYAFHYRKMHKPVEIFKLFSVDNIHIDIFPI